MEQYWVMAHTQLVDGHKEATVQLAGEQTISQVVPVGCAFAMEFLRKEKQNASSD